MNSVEKHEKHINAENGIPNDIIMIVLDEGPRLTIGDAQQQLSWILETLILSRSC